MKPLDKVREFLEQNRLDGIITGKRNNFSWLTGGKENYVNNGVDDGVAYLFITPREQYIVASNLEMPRILGEEIGGMGYEPLVYNWYEPFALSTFARMVQGKRLGTDGLLVPGADMVLVQDRLAAIRSVLDESQIEQYRWLARRTTEAVELACRQAEPGQTEQEIRAEISRITLRQGINPMAICVMSDERIFKYRHPIATGKTVRQHVLISVCFERYGLVCSSTRAVYFGRLSDELSFKSEKLAHIDASMISATQPGVTYQQFFAKIKEFYADAGFPDEWKLHVQGGLTGFAPREFHITPETEGAIKINQVYSWNPTITGTKSEDMTLVTGAGPKIFSLTGNWPMLDVNIQGKIWPRPAILVR